MMLYPSIGSFSGSLFTPSVYTPGLTLNVMRSPSFNVAVQKALSGKETRIAYQQYPMMTWTLQYELLRDYLSPSEFKTLFGFYDAVGGRLTPFLFIDPWFNTVAQMSFATTQAGDVAGTIYQLTATYANATGVYAGVGAPEVIQQFNGVPTIYGNSSAISGANYALSTTGALSFNSGHQPSSGTALSWSGSFYYVARFDEDSLDFEQFMANFWTVKVKLCQVKL